MAAAIVPVGSLRSRHIFGVSRLRARNPGLFAFVIATTEEKHKGPFSVFRNALKVTEGIPDAVLVGANPLDEVDVARAFMDIYERVREEKKRERVGEEEKKGEQSHPTIYVDITSTTKTLIRVTVVFAILFGFRPYTVAAQRGYTNRERTKEMLKALFDPESAYYGKIKAALSKYPSRPKQTIARLERILEQGTLEIGYHLKTNSIGVRVDLNQLPLIKPIELKDRDRRALMKLREIGDSSESITELASAIGLTKKSEQISLGYRIKKLRQWALISPEADSKQQGAPIPAKRRKKQRIELTPIGKGIADALKKGSDPVDPASNHSTYRSTESATASL